MLNLWFFQIWGVVRWVCGWDGIGDAYDGFADAADALEKSERLVSSLFKSAEFPTLNGSQSPTPQQKVEMRSTP